MKRKVEKYLWSKNINGMHRLKDENGNYLIGDDIQGCLRAARAQPASHLKGKDPLKIEVGSNMATPTPMASRKKRKTELNSLFSPAIAPKIRMNSPNASQQDRKELLDFCRTLRGGYVGGIYRSAIERRKMAESTVTTGLSLTKALNDLNLTTEERSRLPPFFLQHTAKLLDPYSAPPSSSEARNQNVTNSARREPPTPFHIGFDEPASPSINPVTKVLLQPQLRPSPLMSKRDNLDVSFMPCKC